MSQIRGQVVTLLASAVQSASSAKAFTWPAPDKATILLNVTASSSPTTLDVYVQSSTDAGASWVDLAHFNQVGAVSSVTQALQWSRNAGQATNATSVIATGDATLAAGKVVCGPVADNYMRLKWVLAGTSYTFAVSAFLDRDV